MKEYVKIFVFSLLLLLQNNFSLAANVDIDQTAKASSENSNVSERIRNNSMQMIERQAMYNPHLQDKIIALETAVVNTPSGKLRGSVNDGIFQYLGVPYAEAKERFIRAEKVTPWSGVRDATQYGPISEQKTFAGEPVTDIAVSNNAQNLNIWTPSLYPSAKKTGYGLASWRRFFVR